MSQRNHRPTRYCVARRLALRPLVVVPVIRSRRSVGGTVEIDASHAVVPSVVPLYLVLARAPGTSDATLPRVFPFHNLRPRVVDTTCALMPTLTPLDDLQLRIESAGDSTVPRLAPFDFARDWVKDAGHAVLPLFPPLDSLKDRVIKHQRSRYAMFRAIRPGP